MDGLRGNGAELDFGSSKVPKDNWVSAGIAAKFRRRRRLQHYSYCFVLVLYAHE